MDMFFFLAHILCIVPFIHYDITSVNTFWPMDTIAFDCKIFAGQWMHRIKISNRSLTAKKLFFKVFLAGQVLHNYFC